MSNESFVVFSRRGQVEILGLVIITVLIVIGILLSVVFTFSRAPANPSVEFKEADLSGNILDAMLKTTVKNCNQRTFSEVLGECVGASSVSCGSNPSSLSCNSVNLSAIAMLSSSLKDVRDFIFVVPKGNDNTYVCLASGIDSSNKYVIQECSFNSGSNAFVSNPCLNKDSTGARRYRNYRGTSVDILLSTCVIQ